MEILTAASLKRSIPKPALEWQVDFLETLVVATFAVAVDELRAGTRRSKPVAFARQSAMYLAHTALGLSYSQIASIFGLDRTTAAHACRVIEERRDEPLLDLVLAALERTFEVGSEKTQSRLLS